MDNNDGGFETVEGEIVCDNEEPIAKPCNVRVSRYAAQQRLSCQGTVGAPYLPPAGFQSSSEIGM